MKRFKFLTSSHFWLKIAQNGGKFKIQIMYLLVRSSCLKNVFSFEFLRACSFRHRCEISHNTKKINLAPILWCHFPAKNAKTWKSKNRIFWNAKFCIVVKFSDWSSESEKLNEPCQFVVTCAHSESHYFG